MEIDEQYELYEKLMLKALEEPNDILNTCIRVIITMSKMNDDSNEEFKKILDFMGNMYDELPSHKDMILKAMIIKKVMDL